MNNIASPSEGRDAALYLELAARASDVCTHADLWQWLCGDVQRWLPHDALLVGWGDFDRGSIEFDIVSSVPGLRSRDFSPSGIEPLLRYLRDCWVAALRMPCEVSLAGAHRLVRDCSPLSWRAVGELHAALVHGATGRVAGRERIVAALSRSPGLPAAGGQALKLLLPLVDSALQRIPPVEPRGPAALHVDPGASLSDRESEVMHWVALGKTNPEIGTILGISEFTVKNHLKSIFGKLDVTNRAQAVAKLNRGEAHA